MMYVLTNLFPMNLLKTSYIHSGVLARVGLIVATFLGWVLSVGAQPSGTFELIDVTTLEQLNAIRYDMDGDGTPDSWTTPGEQTLYRTAFGLEGSNNNTCRDGCEGYELMRDLDFNDMDPDTEGEQPSRWSKNCTTDCVTGTRADGTTGNIGWDPIPIWRGSSSVYDGSLFKPFANVEPEYTLRENISFSARFHGNGLVIRNLYINEDVTPSGVEIESFTGFFDALSGEAAITNLGLEDVDIEVYRVDPTSATRSSSYVGALVGRAADRGLMEDCYATGRLVVRTSDEDENGVIVYIGGLAGWNTGVMIGCYAMLSVLSEGKNLSKSHVGGLVGRNQGLIISCYATGNVSSSAAEHSYVGGIAGMNNKRIASSFAMGNVLSNGKIEAHAGGIMGYGESAINLSAIPPMLMACYATGNVSSFCTGAEKSTTVVPTSSAGGIAGYLKERLLYSDIHIEACYATGDVSSEAVQGAGGSGVSAHAGGILGKADGQGVGEVVITACYATGDVEGTAIGAGAASYAGGILGLSGLTTEGDLVVAVTACYYDNSATISGGTTNTDGAQSKAALQMPTVSDDNTDATDNSSIYEQWAKLELDDKARFGIDDITQRGDAEDDDVWDFGTSTQYPSLKVDFSTGTGKGVFGPQREPFFASEDYDFPFFLFDDYEFDDVDVGTVAGTVVGGLAAVIVHDLPITFSVISQSIDDATATTSDFLFSVGNYEGFSFADLTLATDALEAGTYTLGLQAQETVNRGTGNLNADIEVTATVPDAPLNIQASAVSDRAIDITWERPLQDGGAPITSYQLQASADGGASWTNLHTTSNGSTFSYRHNISLSNPRGTTYHYQVAAVNRVGVGPYTNPPASATTFDIPGTPQNVTAEAVSTGQIDLQWEAPDHDGGTPITSYQLQYQEVGGSGSWIDLHTTPDGSTFSYAHTGLKQGTTYYYRVAATNDVDQGFFSNPPAGARTHDLPNVPLRLMATAVSGSRIDLEWRAPSNDGGSPITSYELWYAEDETGPWIDLYTTPDGGTLSYAHSGLDRGTIYYYRVAATNDVGQGPYTDPPASATTFDFPGAPNSLVATTISRAQIDLGWEAPSDDGGTPITGYRLQTSANETGPWRDLSRISDGSTFSYAHSGLNYEGVHYYRVAAVNDVGTGPYTDPPASAENYDLPSVPKNLVATTVSGSEIDLRWEAPDDNGGTPITGYRLQVSEDEGTSWVEAHTTSDGSTLSYAHTGLERGTTYHYRVAAINRVDAGPYTDPPAFATTLNVPSAPRDLTATVMSGSRVRLLWQAPNNDGGAPITNYHLQISTNGGTSWRDLHTTSNGSTLSYLQEGLPEEYLLHYQVAAVNSVGTGAYSEVAFATTYVPPDAPRNLTATAVSGSQIDLAWEAPSDDGGIPITGYQLQVLANGTDFWVNLHTVADERTLSYAHTGLPYGSTYYYRVAAINSVYLGAYSDVAAATTYDVPDAPTGLRATAMSGSQIDVSWRAPISTGTAEITSYQVRVSVDGGNIFTDLGVLPTDLGLTGTDTNIYQYTDLSLPTYQHIGLEAGSTRHYQVAAISSVGAGPYADPPASATTHNLPSAPRDLVATAASDSQIDLAWQAPNSDGGSPITSYYLQVSEDGGASWTTLHTIYGRSKLSYSDMGLEAGSTRHYQVAAINSVGQGPYTDPMASATTYNLPSAPRDLTATAVSDSQIDLTWQAPNSDGGSPITGYQLQVSEDEGASWTSLHTTNGSMLSYAHMGLDRGTTYHYRVAAVNSVGMGPYTDPMASATTLNVPSAPRDLTAMAVSGSQIDLTWQAPDDEDMLITGYQLQVSEDGGTSWSNLDRTSDGSTLSYSHMGLSYGATYHYQVAAFSGAGLSAYSNVAFATTYELPGAPTSLVAMVVSGSQIDLTWQAPSDDGGSPITGYQLQVSANGGTSWANLHRTSDGSTLSYAHMDLEPGSTRHYQVAAVSSVGMGAYSNVAFAITYGLPGAPTSLVAMAVGDSQIDLTWQAPSDDGGSPITGYQLQVSEDRGASWSNLHRTSDGSTLSYAHMGLKPGSTRHYQVAAINSVGMGAYSNVAFATLGGVAPVAEDKLILGEATLYPNPTSERAYLVLPSKDAYIVQIHTLTGKILREVRLEGHIVQPIDIGGVQEGVYVINVRRGTAYNSTHRLIKLLK